MLLCIAFFAISMGRYKALEAFSITDLKERHPASLSGGEK